MQINICIFAMRHKTVNVQKLTRRLKKAVGVTPIETIARGAKIDASRVSRFLNGDFKKMTPVLNRLCVSLGVPVKNFLVDSPSLDLSSEILVSLRRIIGQDAQKMVAVTRLFRNLETLAMEKRKGRGA